jgi:nucleotide-binding universal stress UspA family protein
VFKRILIPTDGYGLEEHVIRYSAAVFPFGQFYVVSVIDSKQRGVQLTTLLHEMLQKSADKAVTQAEKILKEEGIEPHKVEVLRGIPSKEIIHYTEKHEISLVVMRSYAHHGVQSMRLGSTIENTLKNTKTPILILGEPVAGNPPQRILIPTDGSHGSQNAENLAIEMALGFGAELVGSFVCNERGKKCSREFGTKVLKNLEWKCKQMGVKFRYIIKDGDPADGIIALSNDVDIIIMGAGRKGFMKRIVMGHVSREIASISSKPVILVRGRVQR